MTTDKPDKATRERWHADPNNWKLGVLYFNKEDKRLLPPKRLQYLGWTINFANPWSILILVLIAAIMFVVTRVITALK